MQGFNLLHERFINTQATCGIDNHHIKIMASRPIKSGSRYIVWFLIDVTWEKFSANLFSNGL
jgi:hypothetical protein